MASRCEICGKRPMSGHTVSHSQRHTKRRFRPNIQSARIPINGQYRRVDICTRCLRTLEKKGLV